MLSAIGASHVPAIVGLFGLFSLPIYMGMVMFGRTSAWEKFRLVLITPFSSLLFALLVAWGWGDWSDVSPNTPNGFTLVAVLFGAGAAFGVLRRFA